MESHVHNGVWVAKTLHNELVGVYDSFMTANAMLHNSSVEVNLCEYSVVTKEDVIEKRAKEVQNEIDLGVHLCKHIELPSPFCESLPDKLLDGAEVKKKWDRYCHEMAACNREIECVLKEKSIPHFVAVKEALVEKQEEQLIVD